MLDETTINDELRNDSKAECIWLSEILETIHIKLLQEKYKTEWDIQTRPPQHHEQIQVSHILGGHAMFPHHENIWHLSEHGHSCPMCEMVTGTQRCLEIGVGAPCNRCLCQAIVKMISSSLMQLNDCHIVTHDCMLVYTFCHDEITEKEVRHKDYHIEVVLITNTQGKHRNSRACPPKGASLWR
jgi:hypothetical protein